MSGGAWSYKQFKIEEMAEEVKELLLVVSKTEHIVDWAVSADTSREDAKEELFQLWYDTFEKLYGDGIDG